MAVGFKTFSAAGSTYLSVFVKHLFVCFQKERPINLMQFISHDKTEMYCCMLLELALQLSINKDKPDEY